jgi:DNA-binding beta-propeller fold protein YncE
VKLLASLLLVPLAVAAAAGASSSPRLVLPYDVEALGRVLYVADAGRHQVLRYDLRTRRLTVVAGTGAAGSSGDGGPARRARIDEVAGLAFDRAGNLYLADVAAGRVRRVARNGAITTVARIPAAAGVSVDPSGRYLAIASIESRVYRLELGTRRLRVIAGDGVAASTGDGGAAVDARVNEPHSVAYLRNGDLLVPERDGVRRIDARIGTIETIRRGRQFKVEPGPGGALYVIDGDPTGGVVERIGADGRTTRFVGTGRLSPHRDRQRRTRAGILPSDVETLPDGSVLVVQTEPVPAIRRIAAGSATMTTLLR